MKKIIFAALCLLAAACSTRERSDHATLNFEVKNPTVKTIEVSLDRTETFKVELDAEGRATLTMPNKGCMYPRITYGEENEKIFVGKGETVDIKFDGTKFKGQIKVEGDNTEGCDFMQQVSLPKPPDYVLDWEPFMAEIDTKYADFLALMEKKGLDKDCPEFFEIDKARVDYMFAHTLLLYPMGHAWKAGEFSYDDRYYDALKRLIVEREDLIDVDAYRSYIERAIAELLQRKETFRSPVIKTVATINYIVSHFGNERVKQVMTRTIALNYILATGDKPDDLLAKVRQVVTDPELLNDFNEQVANLDPLSVGFLSPDFVAEDMTGKTYSLKDFAGKYLYIDVWASWCNPCRKEQEALKALEKQFAKRRVTFLSLSVDKDRAAWEKAVKEGKLSGTHLWMGADSEFQKAYNIKSIPRFIMLDPKGRIVNIDMDAPSSEQVGVKLLKMKYL